MSYRVEEVKVDKATIERHLGAGQFEYWTKAKNEAKEALATFDRLKARIPVRLLPYLAGWASYDADMVEKTTHDWGWGLELITNGKKVSKKQLSDISEIQSASLEALHIENAVIDAILTAGVLAQFLHFQFNNLEAAAAAALPKIKALETELRKAKLKVVEASIQTAIDVGLFVLTIFVPHLGVIAKTGIAVGQWAMDELLGGNKSTALNDTLSSTGTNLSMIQPAIENWSFLSPAQRQLTKGIGGKLSIAGLYFDQDEIRATLSRVDAIKLVINKAVEELKTVKRLLEQHRPAMARLNMQLKALGRSVKDHKDKSEDWRNEYRDLADKANYPSTKPVQWQYEN
jgi:hypothetical protein